MTVTRRMTWFTGSLILLALSTVAAESFAGGGPDCPYEKRTITKSQPQSSPVEAQKPAKATPAQSPAPSQKQTPAPAETQKRTTSAPA